LEGKKIGHLRRTMLNYVGKKKEKKARKKGGKENQG